MSGKVSPYAGTLEVRLGELEEPREEFVRLGGLWRNAGDLDRDCLRWWYRFLDTGLPALKPNAATFHARGNMTRIAITDTLRVPLKRLAAREGGSESWAYRILLAAFLDHQMLELNLSSTVSEATFETVSRDWWCVVGKSW